MVAYLDLSISEHTVAIEEEPLGSIQVVVAAASVPAAAKSS